MFTHFAINVRKMIGIIKKSDKCTLNSNVLIRTLSQSMSNIFFCIITCIPTSNFSIIFATIHCSTLLFSIPEFNSLTRVDIALVTLSAATSRSFLNDRPKLLLVLLEPLPGKLFVLNADLTSKISIFLAQSNFQIKILIKIATCNLYYTSIVIPFFIILTRSICYTYLRQTHKQL